MRRRNHREKKSKENPDKCENHSFK